MAAAWKVLAALLTFISVSVPGAAQQRDEAAVRALERDVRLSRTDPRIPRLPAADSIPIGGRIIPAGATLPGPAVTARGDLDVRGTVEGDAVAFDGNVILAPGGRVTGDAVAVRGRVLFQGGALGGESRTLSAIAGRGEAVAGPVRSRWQATVRSLQITGTILALALVLGFGVLLFAGDYLDAVARTIETRFGRSFVVGVLGQLAIAPVLVLALIGLTITILGILLIPFATVAYCLAVAGALALGFLAVAEVTGMPLVRRNVLTPRRAALRALILGTVLYLGLWVLAAAFTWQPLVGGMLRVFAGIVTWVAISTGFGAVILSRVGRRRPEAVAAPMIEDFQSWQTPTPVGGVAAARRPTPAVIRQPR